MPREESFLHQMIRGAIGKEYVIKHYRRGRIFRTKFPDMTRIVATEKQRACRNKFRDAVAYAKEYISDETRKNAYKPWFRKRKRVFNQLIKDFMLREKKAKWMAERLTERLLMLAMREGVGDFLAREEKADNRLEKAKGKKAKVNVDVMEIMRE